MQDIIAKARAFVGQLAKKIRSLRKDAVEETEEIIRDAETEEVFVSVTAKEAAKRWWEVSRKWTLSLIGRLSSRERMALLFAAGLIVGFAAKTVASEYLVIGYRDYTTKSSTTYDLIELQRNVAENGGAGILSGSGVAPGGTCSQ